MESRGNVWLKELTYGQRITLAYVTKPFALISAVTTTWVAIIIFRDKEKMAKMYHRLSLGMCICGSLNAFYQITATWLLPSDKVGYIHAWGNIQTCTISGFVGQLGFVVQYYYVSLSIYVFMALRCEFRIKEIEWIEKYFHIGVFIFPLGSSIFLTTQKMFNPIGTGCWINSSPYGCDTDAYGPCMRGSQNPSIYLLLFGLAPVALNFIISTSAIIACYVNEQLKFKRILNSGCLQGKKVIFERARRKKSMLIARQGACYLATFYLSHMFSFIAVVVQYKTKALVFPTLLLASIFFPMDGFFFALCYMFLLSKKTDKEVLNIINVKEENTNKRRNSFIFFVKSKANDDVPAETHIRNSLPTSRQSWCVGDRTVDIHATPRQTIKSRASFAGVSIFDGTDEEKWKMFGVHIGSDSEDSDSDYDLEIENFAEKFFSKSEL